jgi:hypothetical protein
MIRKKKEPPDKIRTVKSTLDNIIRDKNNKLILFDAVNRANQIVIQTYQFLRLYILKLYHEDKEILTINKDIILKVFNVLVIHEGCGKRATKDRILNDFYDFYNSTFCHLNNNVKLNAVRISQILGFCASDIKKNIDNNIKLHFIAYVNRFVNISFKKEHKAIIDATKHGDKTKISKELSKNLYDVKQDLINNTLLSDVRYHIWLEEHRKNIFPYICKNTYEHDIENNPQKYIKSMIYMCLKIEELEAKSFQFFPLRTSIIPKYIQIDTAVIIRLFEEETNYDQAQEDLNNIKGVKHNKWLKYFKINKKLFIDQKDYSFDYTLYTDGFGVSIKLLHASQIEPEQTKKDNRNKKKNKNFMECSKMETKEEQINYRKKLQLEQQQKEEDFKLSIKEKQDKHKKEFKNLPKEEQDKIRDAIKKNKHIEFPYLEELNDEQLDNLKKSNWVVIDPGKRCLLYMKNNTVIDKTRDKTKSYINRLINKNRIKLPNEAFIKKLYIKKINLYKNKSIKKINTNKFIKLVHQINYRNKIIEKNKFKSLKQYKRFLKYKNRRNKLNKKNKLKPKNMKITNCLRYTNKRWIKETKRKKYQKLLHNYKNKHQINKIENELSSYNAKTCNYKKFKEYIKQKNNINSQLFNKYKETIFRRYKWYGFINRKKVEMNIVNEIKKTFGKDVILCYGDWSISRQMNHFISTPNLRLKRKLGEHFIIYNIDEFRTSCLNYKTEEENENMYYLDKKLEPRKIHSVLTYQMENNCLECINRDENAVRNMLKIVNCYLKDKTRPINFMRSTKKTSISKPKKTPVSKPKKTPVSKPKKTPVSKPKKTPVSKSKNDTNPSKKKGQLIVSSSLTTNKIVGVPFSFIEI